MAEGRDSSAKNSGTWLATLYRKRSPRFQVSADADGSYSVAKRSECTVVFDGLLHTRREWLHELSDSGSPTPSDAELVLRAYLTWPHDLLDRLKGLFALVVWDGRDESLLCARDPHGMHPFFYADAGDDLLLSSSVEALVKHPRVPGEVDRTALADHLCHRWAKLDATSFAAVRRLPGGHALRIRDGTRSIKRYWDPIPPGRPIDYLSDDEVSRFGELLDDAVDRCLRAGPAAIYLSGGLDSISVAAVAQDALERRRMKPLLALSLVFEHPLANEEAIQREVASDLGLAQEIETISKAVGPKGLLASALGMSARRPAPMINLWNPAYRHLAERARDQGYRVILTGNGGDEWLEAGVHKARRALREFDFLTLYQLWSSMQRSYNLTKGAVARNLLWTYGMRPIIREGASRIVGRAAPGTLTQLRRQRMEKLRPAWVAPEPDLRESMFERYRVHLETTSRGALNHPMVAYELEEFYESGRELGMRLLHPFWDADLTAFTARAPTRMLIRGGRSKGLVRQRLAERFPGIGFDRHRKVDATGFFESVLIGEGNIAWREMGGAQALAELRIVNPDALEKSMTELFEGNDPHKAYQIWYVLSLESWLRSRL